MEEVLNLVDFSNSRVRIVNIIGSPGFGKSTLVIHVGHEVVKKGDIVHYINLADFPDTDVKLVLAEKILDSARIVAKDVTFERALRWARERYYNNLLILDNCDDVLNSSSEMGEFQDAMKKLVEQSKNIKIIVTSRKLVPSLNFYEWVRVDKLNDAAAYKLIELKVESKVNLTQEEKEELAKHTGNVPLALQIVGSLLRLPSAPTRTPRTVISELQENPMKILTSPVFPADEQIFTTISLSYNYLSKEAKEVGCQLSVFPGSFTQDAALKICRSDSVAETLSNLVWNSLLEHNKRNDRYQYHQLIREYFLYVQKMEHSNFSFAGYTRLQLSFHVYYADMLRTESWQYNSVQFDKSLTFLDSELHNIKYILQENHLSSLPIREFVVTAVALSEGVDNGLLTMRFSKEDLCTALQTSLIRLDSLIQGDFQYKQTLLHTQWSPTVEDALWFTKEEILSHFMLIIDRVATCEEEANGIEAAGQIYMQHLQIVEERIVDIELSQYKNFYTTLSNYFLEQGDKEGVIFCHMLMLKRTNAHLVKCEKQYQCNYYDIGVIYFDIEEYQMAAEFLEQWLLMLVGNDCLDRMKVLIKLLQTYDALNEHEKRTSIHRDLLELQEEILNTDYAHFLRASIPVQNVIAFYRKEGLHDHASLLEEKLIISVKEVGVKRIQASWCFSQQKCNYKVPTDWAFRVIQHFYEVGNYSATIELGMHYINAFMEEPKYKRKVASFQVLVGKALFLGGNYSEGMDQMEIVLHFIEEHDLRLDEEKWTACRYLIPRVKYMESCYAISRMPKILIRDGSLLALFLLFSPYPLPRVAADTTSDHNIDQPVSNPESRSAEQTKTSHGVMSSPAQDYGALSTIYSLDGWQILNSKLNPFQLLPYLYYSPLPLLEKTYHFFYIPIWILVVWMKLLWLLLLFRGYTDQQLLSVRLFLIEVILYYYYIMILSLGFAILIIYASLCYISRLSEIASVLVLALRNFRDPRFLYCEEDSPYFINNGDIAEAIQLATPIRHHINRTHKVPKRVSLWCFIYCFALFPFCLFLAIFLLYK